MFTDSAGIILCTLESFEVLKHLAYPYPTLSQPFTLEYQVLLPSLLYDLNNHTETTLFNEKTSSTFKFRFGAEAQLQSYVPNVENDLWILAREGLDGDAAIGFVRCLSRELLEITIRIVIYPAALEESIRTILDRLPNSLADEQELYVTSKGEIAVPRLVTIPDITPNKPKIAMDVTRQSMKDKVSVRISRYSSQGAVSGFVGTVVSSEELKLSKNSVVVGVLDSQPTADVVLVNVNSLHTVPSGQIPLSVPALLSGSVVGVYAAPSKRFDRIHMMRSQKVLLTHCETMIGLGVKALYATQGVVVVEVPSGISLLDLSRLGSRSFDLIVSGYEDESSIDIVKSLLKPLEGRVYLWNDIDVGVAATISKDPWFIGDTLRDVVSCLSDDVGDIEKVPIASTITHSISSPGPSNIRTQFDKTKSYLILGGIGSLGAQIALWMYEVSRKFGQRILLTKCLERSPTFGIDFSIWKCRFTSRWR